MQNSTSIVFDTHDSIGNLEPLIEVYPDRPAPVVRNIGSRQQLTRLTWGMPTTLLHKPSDG